MNLDPKEWTKGPCWVLDDSLFAAHTHKAEAMLRVLGCAPFKHPHLVYMATWFYKQAEV